MNDQNTPPPANAVPPMRGPLRKTSISQQVYEALRNRIIDLELVPGLNLSRVEIADFYSVSQTPVRDAMLKLEEEGLLVIFPQSKTEVSRINIDQARETQFLRVSLETEVVRKLATSGTDDCVAEAKVIITRQKSAFDADDLPYFQELDRAFHKALFTAAGLENLWHLIDERSGQIDRLRKLNLPVAGKTKEIIKAHSAIVAAIERKDADDAENQVRTHLSGTLGQIDMIMARHPAFF
ncbi:DNA-binding transcriptional regulator, GntR family [Sulfitobacter marinus]|uniref:DNA-binding transcriptional regulator, GntR family n=1 Tax=Sulfitobacter marinus TaxID=394264 RepID=A0A1I6QHH3_9RHOB|nr:GntR family transcriptional regulator [Sulfitobacter marinus]SFS51760.1 DNA-binding transcriptional regulator, GntR family [Sulfitobacter marinus]